MSGQERWEDGERVDSLQSLPDQPGLPAVLPGLQQQHLGPGRHQPRPGRPGAAGDGGDLLQLGGAGGGTRCQSGVCGQWWQPPALSLLAPGPPEIHNSPIRESDGHKIQNFTEIKNKALKNFSERKFCLTKLFSYKTFFGGTQ